MESKFSKLEAEILKFWQTNKIFEKSVSKPSPKGEYVFYDGPPFATGTPHYGHIVASLMKDVVPRFWTMNGYRVERRWGWDCHGLPIENIVEKELGFKTKKEIEEFGIDKFNETCRSKVLQYASEWEKTIPRLGRWVDMTNPYKTMDLEYMESIWWVFKELWDRDLIYQDYKSMHVCPRCETTLSQQEVSEGYKDIKDLSVTAKFELVDEPGTFILAWTTTPWTLPGNVALAINGNLEYLELEIEASNVDDLSIKKGEKIIIANDTNIEIVMFGEPLRYGPSPHEGDYSWADVNFKQKGNILFKNIRIYKAKELAGKKYKPLFDDYLEKDLENKENLYTVILADFVTTNEGTGVVHIAPAFGEDDMNAGRAQKLPFIQHVRMDGHIEGVKGLDGLSVKPIDDHTATDVEVLKILGQKNLIFSNSLQKYEHSYPHCWRCDTPLINYATSSWFVKVTAIKDKALKEAKDINWSPNHLKEGRFGKWLEGARDWSISRQRFWASVMPIWICEKCGEQKVYGSVAELEKDSGKKITDLHKHFIDQVTVSCKCGGTMKRVPDVLDTWFDSGSMPYAQMHYPFANQKKFEQNFPAEFIAEGVDQTRAWFYYLHVISTAIKKKPAFKNVIVNGIVLAQDGKKMAKRLHNYPEPDLVIDQYGADAIRYYLLTSPVIAAETLNFSESGVKEALQKVVMLVGNVLSFYLMYKKSPNPTEPGKAQDVLDRWILAKLNLLNQEVTKRMQEYDLVRATRGLGDFVDELSTWYLRRSRERFKSGDEQGVEVLGFVLQEFAKIAAPFMPFITEEIYRQIGGEKESVHLETWPPVNKKLIDQKLLDEMTLTREIVERGLAARAQGGIKVRQPLAAYTTSLVKALNDELVELVKDELNIKELKFGAADNLDLTITDELKLEGLMRELVRQINQLRKEAGLTVADQIELYQQGFDELFEKFGEEIKRATLTQAVKNEKIDQMKGIAEGQIGIKKLNN
ncbi:MAG: class I tRNA ligase family protein [Patescibacteria group bacterium]|jgi:isoleucyl-tRNA synthetase|nr:class I tRNA ligase family protein [Patescibacteria group bacterium]